MSRKTKADYTESEYLDEFVRLWVSACREVYLKNPTPKQLAWIREDGVSCWQDCNETPLRNVLRRADPTHPTNEIAPGPEGEPGRGQKARERRWEIWVKENAT